MMKRVTVERSTQRRAIYGSTSRERKSTMMSPQSTNPARNPRARRRTTALLLGAALIAAGGTVAFAAPAAAADCATVPWMDTSKSADQRAEALLAASSQHQKYRWLVEQPANSPQQTTWSGGVVYPVQVDCTPTVIYSNGAEGAHGKAGTTAWPGPIAIAASWNLDERTFRQVYDLPYEIAIKESDPDSLMCSYNQINGIWSCENDILTTSLRDKMGFDGYVMSDFGSVHSTGPSLMAGLDQELNRPIWFTPVRLDAALAAGEITQQRIDQAAFRVVRTYIKAGLFDHPLPATSVPVVATDEARALARELAEESAVLLKNDDGLLPLDEGPLTVAVVGPTASKVPTNGVSSAQACSAGGFGAGGVLNCANVVDPLTAITERVQAAGG